MAWQFILTDLYGTVHGEVTQALERKVGLPHLRIPSASCRIPLWHPLAGTAVDTDTLLKCYRIDPVSGTKSLAFHGPVVSAEEVGDESGQSVAITAAGPYWRMTKRLIPGSTNKSGIQYGAPGGLVDLGTIARTIVSDVNGVDFSGIDLGTQTAATTGWVGVWWMKNAAEGIASLAAGLNTFEFRVRPTEPTAYANPNNWPRIGLFDVAPTIGASRPDAVFEYGTPRANVASYNRAVSRDGLLNDARISVSGWPDSVDKDAANNDKYAVQQSTDTTSIASRGRFEELVGDAGVLDNNLRKSIADYHVLLRKNPRQIITFKPALNARPAPFIDYDVGDTVRARVVVTGNVRVDALFRIWGVSFDIDENGNESVELELVMP